MRPSFSMVSSRRTLLISDLFIESNPIPIKYVMKRLGYGNGKPRLPLTELSPQFRPILDMDIAMLGLI